MPSSDRRLVAIMFTDIVGYTKLSQAKESLALELLEEHRSMVRPLLASHGGTEVKTIGDAFLVEFRSALDAVLCAAEIQQNMERWNSRAKPDRRMQLRIGIHLGDVVHESGDVYGDAVNVASRIEPLAEPGGLCITQQVFESVRNKTDFEMARMGEVGLKNVELPMAVYRVNLSPMIHEQDEGAPRERLAVLPFVNISPDPNDEYFADGLTEELISKLSEVKGLKVIARTSVMNYKKKEKNISQIGRELEAGSIIEGSVRKAGNKIRVTVQLIDSKTEEHLWASNYDNQLDDIFAIQTDVASKVAKSISSGYFLKSKENDTADVNAYTMYLKGIQLTHEGSEKSLREAVSLFGRALGRDPQFARAHAGLATAWVQLCISGYDEFDLVSSNAEPAARRGIALGPDFAETHASLAGVTATLDKFEEAKVEAERALKLNPNLAEAYFELGVLQGTNGDLERALLSMERSHELDPLSIRMGIILSMVARVAGKIDRSQEVLEKMDQFSPSNPRILEGMAEGFVLKGDFPKAQELLDKAFGIDPGDPVTLVGQGVLYATIGKKDEALEILSKVMKNRNEAPRLYGTLFIQASLGNIDEAAKALERMSVTHSWPFLVGSMRMFSELRKDPRYAVFAKAVGLSK